MVSYEFWLGTPGRVEDWPFAKRAALFAILDTDIGASRPQLYVYDNQDSELQKQEADLYQASYYRLRPR